MSDPRSSQFCPRCDVHTSLHPSGDGSPEDCRAADLRANLLERARPTLTTSNEGETERADPRVEVEEAPPA